MVELIAVYALCLCVEGGGGGALSSSEQSLSTATNTSPSHVEAKGVTLSGRFTAVGGSSTAEDSVLSLSSFIRKKNGEKQLDVDRT